MDRSRGGDRDARGQTVRARSRWHRRRARNAFEPFALDRARDAAAHARARDGARGGCETCGVEDAGVERTGGWRRAGARERAWDAAGWTPNGGDRSVEREAR